jgi:hypothetical protein
MGFNWIGVELEEKFVKLGEENINLWGEQLRGWPNLGTARIVQGDSRNLRNVIKQADIVISSPPFTPAQSGGGINKKGYTSRPDLGPDWVGDRTYSDRNVGHTPGNLANLKEGKFEMVVGSPPFCESLNDYKHGLKELGPNFKGRKAWEEKEDRSYGQSPGQLGSMKEGKFEMVVGSPPFVEAQSGGGIAKALTGESNYPLSRQGGKYQGYRKDQHGKSPGQLGAMKEGSFDLCVSSPPYVDSEVTLAQTKGCFGNPENMKLHTKNRDKIGRQYSKTKGQLGQMKEGSIDAVISSPPYEDVAKRDRSKEQFAIKTGRFESPGKDSQSRGYNPSNKRNLGTQAGDTFWSASREILQQCFDLLKSGGFSIWVTKNYIKRGKIVPFSDRWLALCESVGFKLVCRHQAMLVKEYGRQKNIRGEEEIIQTERKSFFRRLAESKGSPRIDFEDIICLVK